MYFLKFAAMGLGLAIAGCSSFSPDGGFGTVKQATQAGYRLAKNGSAAA